MSDKINRHPRRAAWRCRYDYYCLPAWRERTCSRGSQLGRTAPGYPTNQCNRERMSPELPLVMSERFFPGSLGVLLANG